MSRRDATATIPMPIETRRLVLRPFTHADVVEIHAIYSDPAVWEHIDGAEHRTR